MKENYKDLIRDLDLILSQDEEHFVRFNPETQEVLLNIFSDQLEIYDMYDFHDRNMFIIRILEYIEKNIKRENHE